MSNRLLFLSLVLIGIAVSGISLFNPYYFDDLLILHDNAWLFEARPFRWFNSIFLDSNRIFTGYRPTLMATFWANVQLLGESPAAFRVVNIGLHILNSLLVVELVRTLRDKTRVDFFSWSIGALFLLHPVQTLGINFLWKRSSLLEASFLFTAMILHVRERQRGNGYRPWVILVEAVLFLLALTTKESAVILPLLLLLIDLLYFGVRRSILSLKGASIYLLLFPLFLGFLWFRLGFVEGQTSLHLSYLGDIRAALFEKNFLWTTLNVIRRYVVAWIAPQPRLFEDPSPLNEFPWAAAITVLGLFLLTLVAIVYRREKPLFPFCALLFWVGLAPTTGRREILFVMDQIRLYLPLMGLSGVLVFFLDAAARRIHCSPKWIIGGVIVLYAAISGLQNRRYAHPLLIWGDVVETYPASGLARGSFASIYAASGDYGNAAKEYAQAYRLEPLRVGYSIDELAYRLKSGESPSGIRSEIARRKFPNMDIVAKTKLAVLLDSLGDIKTAETLLLEVVAENGSYGLAHLRLAQLWERTGNKAQARLAYENALQLMPNHPAAEAGAARLRK